MHRTPTNHEDETRLTTTSDPRRSDAPSRVPCLTLLAHPDPRRVGQRVLLPSLALGRPVSLSRLHPGFRSPEDSEENGGEPLADRSVSRSPLRLVPGEEPGSLSIDTSETSTPVVADGRPIEGRRLFAVDEIERGVVLLVGRHVALLLGRALFPSPSPPPRFGLVGESGGVVELRQDLGRLAPLRAPVLLRGESGTGKELAARALHDGSKRCDGPWIAVNMATLAPSLAAAELFGAVRGAYTGADREKTGYFRSAEGGTLFLDEIGETPAEVQAMLLRALENHEIVPVGGVQPIPIDVRVIAATDARLEQAMAEGRFRTPLYHRLAGYTVQLPPLRRRRDDIGRLLFFFLDREATELGTHPDGGPPRPPAKTVARLARHSWPGNVRELRNVARRLAIRPDTAVDDLLPGLPGPEPPPASSAISPQLAGPAAPADTPTETDNASLEEAPKRRTRRRPDEVSEDELLAALEAHGYRMRQTAEALNLSRMNFYRRLEQSPNVRKAADLGRPEIEDILARAEGDVATAALELRVSLQGLKRRMTELDMPRH